MFDEESGFLAAINSDIHDDVRRLVYADWLDERDDPRGEFLRVQVELSRTWTYSDPRDILQQRLVELRDRLDPKWLADVWRCTTPVAPLDVEALIPDLKGQARTTVRLHPRQGEAPLNASKIGGTILWPKDEEWPFCEEDEVPFVAVMQLRKEDVPELGFPDGTDLFQLLWCSEKGDTGDDGEMRVYWRKRSEMTGEGHLETDEESPIWAAPCRLYPERVTDFPSFWELRADDLDDYQDFAEAFEHLATEPRSSWPGDLDRFFWEYLGVLPGTKIGGYPTWIGGGKYLSCKA